MTRKESALVDLLIWLSLIVLLLIPLFGCGGRAGVTSGDSVEDAVLPLPCQNIQWMVVAYAAPCCRADNPFGPGNAFVVQIGPQHLKEGSSYTLPFTVPQGKYLGISSILYSSKLFYFSDLDAHGSYFHIALTPYGPPMRDHRLISVPSTAPSSRFSPPFRFDSGETIYMDFSNGAPFDQWMTANVTGYLSSSPTFQGCNFSASAPPSVIQ